jgi:hypothetical protein
MLKTERVVLSPWYTATEAAATVEAVTATTKNGGGPTDGGAR